MILCGVEAQNCTFGELALAKQIDALRKTSTARLHPNNAAKRVTHAAIKQVVLSHTRKRANGRMQRTKSSEQKPCVTLCHNMSNNFPPISLRQISGIAEISSASLVHLLSVLNSKPLTITRVENHLHRCVNMSAASECSEELSRLKSAMHLFSGRAVDQLTRTQHRPRTASKPFVFAANELVFELTQRLGTMIHLRHLLSPVHFFFTAIYDFSY
jgi:hypothetical protein